MRRTTDTNRIVTRFCRVCLEFVIAVTLITSTVTSCFAQAGGTGLPKGFRPPPPIPKELAIEKPLIDQAQVDDWKPKRLNFQDALSKKLAGGVPKTIDEGFRVNVQALSIEEKRDDLTNTRKAIVRYIDNYVPEKNVDEKKFACRSVVKYAKTLLDGNFHVRMQAVLLIGSLNISPEVPGLRPKPRRRVHRRATDASRHHSRPRRRYRTTRTRANSGSYGGDSAFETRSAHA